jgi:beta-lactamase regulating signal transducer with metallopeptidase domain
MNELWTSAAGWMLRTALGGGLLLLVTCLLMRWTRQPARRQRLGDWGITAALLVALWGGIGPSWLVVAWTKSEPQPEPQSLINEVAVLEDMLTVAALQKDDEPAALPQWHRAPELALAAEELAPHANSPSWLNQAGVVVMLVCSAVAAFFAIRLLLGYVALLRLLWRSETPPPEVRGLFDTMAAGTRWVRLLVSQRLLVPLSCGLVRPTVVLPAAMCRAPAPRQLRWIFAHELTHLRRRDAWSALLFNIGQVFFFAVPWFWWLRRQVRLCQEFVADAAAAEQDEASVEYAEFLVSLANAPAVPVGASAVSGNCSDLFRRVTMLLNDPQRVETRCPRLWTMSVAGGLAALALLVSGFSYRAEAAPDEQVIIIIQGQGEKTKPLILNLQGDEAKTKKEEGAIKYRIIGPTEKKGKDAEKGQTLRLQVKDPANEAKQQDVIMQRISDILKEQNHFIIQEFRDNLKERKKITAVPAGDTLEQLQNVLKKLEQLKKEGKLDNERIHAELMKALEQSQSPKWRVVPLEKGKIINKVEGDGEYFDRLMRGAPLEKGKIINKVEGNDREITIRLKIDKDGNVKQIHDVLQQLNPKKVEIRHDNKEVELQLMTDGAGAEHLHRILEELKAKGIHAKSIQVVPLQDGSTDKNAPEAKVLRAHDGIIDLVTPLTQEQMESLNWQVYLSTQATAATKLRFGVWVDDISWAIAQHLKLPDHVGILVTEVAGDSPAAKAGIKFNDVLVKIGGANVPNNAEEFTKFVAKLKANTPLEAVVLRKGQTLNVGTVTLGEPVSGTTRKRYKDEKFFDHRAVDFDQKIQKAEGEKVTVTSTTIADGKTYTMLQKGVTATVTVNCVMKDGKAQVSSIEVKEGEVTQKYTNVQDVPEPYRAQAEAMVRMASRINEESKE